MTGTVYGRQVRRRVRLLVVGSVAAALCVGTVPSAMADKGDRAFPSEEQVAAAKARADQKARDVGAIKASLLMANQRLEQAGLRAEQAAEAYNGAMWRLQVAKKNVRKAQADAVEARRTVEEQRRAIGSLVAATYQQGTQLTALSAMMGADGPEGVLNQYAGFQGASDSLQADYDRFAAADALAQVFERKAEEARDEQVKAAAEARDLKDQAAAAANAAQVAAAQIAAEKDALIRELAAAQNISVKLAKQRQTALEEIARERAEARARAEAEAAAREQAREDAAAAKARAQARARARAEARAKARAEEAAEDTTPTKRKRRRHHDTPAPAPAPTPPPPPPPPAPAPSHGGVSAVIAFAEAQLGEPYEWAAAGPDTWDCSGLMMMAWREAGVYLPHYSGAQYDAGTPIPVSSARAGDLLFWTSNGAPSGIHHVALSLGGGDFIEAPYTGANVRYNSIYNWYPDYAVRL